MLIVVTVIGVVVMTTHPHDRECIVGRAVTRAANTYIVFGEAVVCGNIITSDYYGPHIPWDGDIKFYHRHEE